MSFADLLTDLMKSHKVTNAGLADIVGVSENSVKKWKKGSVPAYDKVAKIAEYFEVPIEYFYQDIAKKNYGTINKIFNHGSNIPIVGRIQAGYPVESFDDIEGYVSVPTGVTYSEDLFALTVVGDSMMPLVMDGDIIICNKNVQNVNNKICAVTVDGESTLKRIRVDSSGVTLIPTNPMYNEIRFSNKDAEEKNFHVDGVLVQMIRNF